MLNETLTVTQAASLLGIAPCSAYAAIRANQIPHLRIGRRIVIPRPALEKLLTEGR